MLAEAVKEAFPGARFVSVDLQTIRFTDPDPKRPYRYTYLTPRRGQVALVDFDQGRGIEPFEVQLRGGAVTPIRYQKKPKAAASPAKSTSPVKNGKTTKVEEKPSKVAPRKTLLPPRSGANKNNIPEVGGGQTPPRAALSSPKRPRGTRRVFGLRSMSA